MMLRRWYIHVLCEKRYDSLSYGSLFCVRCVEYSAPPIIWCVNFLYLISHEKGVSISSRNLNMCCQRRQETIAVSVNLDL